MHQLDHLVIAAPDLAHAKAAFADATGYAVPVKSDVYSAGILKAEEPHDS